MKSLRILFTIVGIFLLDRLSKILVVNFISLNTSVSVIDGFFDLTYVKNYGAAFGMFDGMTFFIVLVSLIVFAYLIYEIRRGIHNKLITTFICFVIGGLLGNLFDRLVYGYVIDFLDFNVFGYDFAIFNIGDSFIVIGTIMLGIGFFLEEKYGIKDKR